MKIISFDLDGTLTTPEFVDSVWRIGVPERFASKHNLSFQEAQEHILREYDRMGDHDLQWYDLPFWLDRLKLDGKAEELLTAFSHTVDLYTDAAPTLAFLKQHYVLIIVSNATRMFLDMEVKLTGLSRYFDHIISATSDLGMVKRDTALYLSVCDRLHILPQDITHVGDHREFDFETPKKIGIESYFLDRSAGETGTHVIHNLTALLEIFNG